MSNEVDSKIAVLLSLCTYLLPLYVCVCTYDVCRRTYTLFTLPFARHCRPLSHSAIVTKSKVEGWSQEFQAFLLV